MESNSLFVSRAGGNAGMFSSVVSLAICFGQNRGGGARLVGGQLQGKSSEGQMLRFPGHSTIIPWVCFCTNPETNPSL